MSRNKLSLRIGQAASAILLVLAASAVSPTVSHGQIQGWSQPVLLSPPGQFAWFPDVVADLTGQVHVVWSSGLRTSRAAYDSVMYTASPDGTSWSGVNDIFSLAQSQLGESAATRPALFVDAQNHLHIAFTDYSQIFYSIAPAEAAASAPDWAATQPLGSGEPVYFSRLAADTKGRLHLIFTENVSSRRCGICYHVLYRSSDDHGVTWSPPVDVSRFMAGSAKVQLLVDRQDNLHAVWEAGVDGGSLGQVNEPAAVRYAASYDRGASWQPPFEFSSPVTTTSASQARNITIGLDGRDQLVLAWLGLPDSLIYHQISSDLGRTWSDPRPIPGVWGASATTLDDYATATDSAGNVHLVAVGRTAETQKSISLLHMVWNGSEWAEPEAISTLVGDVPEWPRLAIANGNQLHVVWFVRNEEAVFSSETAKAQYTVWYAGRQVDAPLVEATLAPRPTAVPSPELQATKPTSPAAPSTPTPALVGGLASEIADNVAYTESGYVAILARSLVPAILFVALVVIIRTRRR